MYIQIAQSEVQSIVVEHYGLPANTTVEIVEPVIVPVPAVPEAPAVPEDPEPEPETAAPTDPGDQQPTDVPPETPA